MAGAIARLLGLCCAQINEDVAEGKTQHALEKTRSSHGRSAGVRAGSGSNVA